MGTSLARWPLAREWKSAFFLSRLKCDCEPRKSALLSLSLRRPNAPPHAAAPKANAQIRINGDPSRTMAFGAGRGVLKGDFKPRREPPPSHEKATTKALHAPLGLRIDFKGTSLGLFLDLTASRAGPAWGKGGSTSTGRGIAPLPTRREKKLLTHHQIARNRKRSARLAAIATNS